MRCWRCTGRNSLVTVELDARSEVGGQVQVAVAEGLAHIGHDIFRDFPCADPSGAPVGRCGIGLIGDVEVGGLNFHLVLVGALDAGGGQAGRQ